MMILRKIKEKTKKLFFSKSCNCGAKLQLFEQTTKKNENIAHTVTFPCIFQYPKITPHNKKRFFQLNK